MRQKKANGKLKNNNNNDNNSDCDDQTLNRMN